jgi:hypothetical protein
MEIAILSLALVACTYILTTRPITINYNKTLTITQPEPPAPIELSETDAKELNDHRPPTFDNMAAAMNQAFHELGEDTDGR